MDLNSIKIEIRPRNSYQGVDLGFKMASRWFLDLWLLWMASALPLAVLFSIIFFKKTIFAFIAIWWLKPVYETPLLYWLSRAIFNERPQKKEILRNIIPILKPQLFSRLTYKRLTPFRSFFMSCILLESLKGKAYRKRTAILGDNQSAGYILTFICFIFEYLVFIGSIILITIMIQWNHETFPSFDIFGSLSNPANLITIIFYFLSVSIIAPFYISSGFSLYISRRTELEAWDIELNFKRLIKRKKTSRSTIASIITLFLIFSFSPFSHLQDRAYSLTKEDSTKIIQEIVKHKDFGKKEKKEIWRLKKDDNKDKKLFTLPEFLKEIVSLFTAYAGILIKILIWTGSGILAVFLIYYALKYTGILENLLPDKKKKSPPVKLFGLELTKDSLPENIFVSAMNLIEENKLRQALSLLYRGALFKYINHDLIEIPESATEKECIQLIFKKRANNEFDFFSELTGIWILNAYGHIKPEKEKLKQICISWKNHYREMAKNV